MCWAWVCGFRGHSVSHCLAAKGIWVVAHMTDHVRKDSNSRSPGKEVTKSFLKLGKLKT